jgi:hypothetical protein
MRAWALLLGGLLVWATDFILLYAIGSIALTTPLGRILTGAVTLMALAADAWLLILSRPRYATAGDEFERWMARTAGLAAALSFLAVLWQGFPAIFA